MNPGIPAGDRGSETMETAPERMGTVPVVTEERTDSYIEGNVLRFPPPAPLDTSEKKERFYIEIPDDIRRNCSTVLETPMMPNDSEYDPPELRGLDDTAEAIPCLYGCVSSRKGYGWLIELMRCYNQAVPDDMRKRCLSGIMLDIVRSAETGDCMVSQELLDGLPVYVWDLNKRISKMNQESYELGFHDIMMGYVNFETGYRILERLKGGEGSKAAATQ